MVYSVSQIDVRYLGEASQYENYRSTAQTVSGMLSPLPDRSLHLFEKRYINDIAFLGDK